MQLNLEAFTSRETIVASLVITVLAVATKFVGCGLASIRLGLRRAAQIGIGMAPRGEVGIVVAQIGLGLGVIRSEERRVGKRVSRRFDHGGRPILKKKK